MLINNHIKMLTQMVSFMMGLNIWERNIGGGDLGEMQGVNTGHAGKQEVDRL